MTKQEKIQQLREEIDDVCLKIEANAFNKSEGTGAIAEIELDTFVSQILKIIEKHTRLIAEREAPLTAYHEGAAMRRFMLTPDKEGVVFAPVYEDWK